MIYHENIGFLGDVVVELFIKQNVSILVYFPDTC
jgi:hypothetical protein